MINDRDKEICELAIKKYGLQIQLGILMEKCAELIKYSNKYIRNKTQGNKINIAEEIAEVEIMIQQVKIALKIEKKVLETKEYKFKKLEKKLLTEE